jgi:Uma2 family endonuclease
MSTAAASSRKRTPAPSGFVFHDVTWDDYEAMLRIVGERRIRVIYDQGEMEIFMPTFGHDNDAFLLGHLVCILAEELDVDFEGGGTTTHKRKDLGKGAEPDECYWFGVNARHMRGKRQLDLTRDPAPDLIIEVDVTRTSLDRLKIFAAMGVPEVWRSTGRSLQFLHLQADGTYQARTTSRNFPTLPVSSVAQFLKDGRTADKRVWIRSFRAFVREKVVPGQRPDGR